MNRMGKHFRAVVAVVLWGTADAPAQGTARDFCEEDLRTECIPDVFEVVFADAPDEERSVLELERFIPGLRLDVEMVLDTRTSGIAGFSYVVLHDIAFVALREGSLTHDGTILDPEHPDAAVDEAPFSALSVFDGGYIVAMVLSFRNPAELPVGRRNILNRASYSLVGNPPETGTRIRVVDRVDLEGRPGVETSFVSGGRTKKPETVVDGLVRRTAPARFIRGDTDGDGRLNITDVALLVRVVLGLRSAPYDCADAFDTDDDGRANLTDAVVLLQWLFRGAGPPPPPFPGCGRDDTLRGALSCNEPGISCGD